MKLIYKYGKEFGISTYLFIVPIRFLLNMFFPKSVSLAMSIVYGLIMLIPLISSYMEKGIVFSVNISKHKQLFIYLVILITLVCQLVFNRNEVLDEYFRYFLLYCLLSYVLACFIVDYRSLFCIILVESVLIGLMLVFQTVYKGVYIGHYMTYGFAMLPILISLSACYTVFGNKLILVPEMLCLYAIFFKANRSCIIAFVVFLVFKWLFCSKEKRSNSQVIKLIALILIGALILLLFFIFLESINRFFISRGIVIRGLDLMVQAIHYSDIELFTAGRGDLWKKALSMFATSPIIGNGIGVFESAYGIYTHNILLDILVQYGMIGLTVFLIFFIKSVNNIKLIQAHEKKVFVFSLLSIWLSKLMLSSSFWEEKTFWIYFIVTLFITAGEEQLYFVRCNYGQR